MKYITGIFALNLDCKLDTNGDWHRSALNWQKMELTGSANSFYGNYGIEKGINLYKVVPLEQFRYKKYNVANHIRALLDLLYQKNFSTAQGMKNDFIGNDAYTSVIFDKISKMKTLSYWNEIDCFMGKEYKLEWLDYKEGKLNAKSKITA